MVLGNGVTIPVIAGLAIGIALVVLFASTFAFKPAIAKSDSELIAETKNLAAVKYLTSKYPDAQVMVNRPPDANFVEVQYLIERELCTPNPHAFGDNCIKTLYLGVIMNELHHPEVMSGCLGPISGSHSGDPIKYIESNECFDSAGDGSHSANLTNEEIYQIDLTIEGLQSTYKAGEHIIFSVIAKGVSNNACNINSPSVVMRDNDSGKTIYWPRPFAFYYAMGCNGADPVDKTWTYGDDAESEIILDRAGSYTVIASLEDVTIEKQFVVTN